MPPSRTLDVAVAGSGPNGLAAAVLFARAGRSVAVYEAAAEPGGGARSARLFGADVVHDLCSAVHPMSVASPFFREFDLEAHGVQLCRSEAAYAQPIDGRRAAVAYADLERTCAGLGVDGARWRRFMTPLIERTDEVVETMFGDFRQLPRPEVAALVASRVLGARAFRSTEARALLAGVAGHALGRLPSLVGDGICVLLGHLAHTNGWPIPRGGSEKLTEALVADIRAHGGEIHTGARVTDLRQLAHARVVMLDLAPKGVLDLAGPLLPTGYRRALQRVRYGPAAAKVDFLVSEPIPWRNPELARAGTLHLGGTREAVYDAENAVAAGKRAKEPYVLLAQPMTADPSRGLPHKQPIWAYAHVPHGDPIDATDVICRRIEQYAPGFRDTVLASRAVPASEMEAYNANYVGGDIATAAVTLRQLLARPVLRWNPHRTPLRGVYLCSAATAPGPGVHGMCGYYAAKDALRREFADV